MGNPNMTLLAIKKAKPFGLALSRVRSGKDRSVIRSAPLSDTIDAPHGP